MPSSFTPNYAIEQPGYDEQDDAWGTTLNNNFTIIDTAMHANAVAAAAAQSTANSAVSAAATAQTSANNAQSTANTGVTNAAAAQATANTAVTNAAAAQTSANNAQSTANAGVTNAAAAQATANSAVSAAATAQSGADASLKKASNLSDLTNSSSARSSLGLGNSAVLNTGTTAGTVATGDATTNAQNTANSASSAAAAAQSTANTGVTNAAAAQSSANNAQSTANTAVSNASSAQSTANTAVSAAATAQSGADASLKKASNLSDLASLPSALANLGMFSKTTANGHAVFNTYNGLSAVPVFAQWLNVNVGSTTTYFNWDYAFPNACLAAVGSKSSSSSSGDRTIDVYGWDVNGVYVKNDGNTTNVSIIAFGY